MRGFLFLLGLPWGAVGIAAAASAAYSVLQPLAIAYCLRGTCVTMLDFAKAIRRPLLASICGGGALCLLSLLGMTSPATWGILFDGVVFSVVYFGTWRVLPGGWKALAAFLAAFGCRFSEDRDTTNG